MWDTVWTFKTAQFDVILEFGPEYDLDLSWDESGETAAKLESGELFAFVARVAVKYNGMTVGENYLGECIYANERDFMQCAYFRDMVRCAIADARATLAKMPRLRAA